MPSWPQHAQRAVASGCGSSCLRQPVPAAGCSIHIHVSHDCAPRRQCCTLDILVCVHPAARWSIHRRGVACSCCLAMAGPTGAQGLSQGVARRVRLRPLTHEACAGGLSALTDSQRLPKNSARVGGGYWCYLHGLPHADTWMECIERSMPVPSKPAAGWGWGWRAVTAQRGNTVTSRSVHHSTLGDACTRCGSRPRAQQLHDACSVPMGFELKSSHAFLADRTGAHF